MNESSKTPAAADPARAEVQRFQLLVKAAQSGSAEAARELHDKYVKYVHKCVRNKMWRSLRTRFDSTDFVQQTWASFFTPGNRLPDFQSPQELIAFLQTVAQRKVLAAGRRQHNQKADVALEQRIDESSPIAGPHPPAHDPTPSSVAVYHEQYDRLVEQQVPEVREVAELRAQGNTFAEIAASLNIDESTARRFMRRIRRRSSQDNPSE